MPSVLIEVRRKYNAAQEVRFMYPPDREKPDRYTHISIDAFAGRSLEAKRLLYKTIVDNLEPLGIPKMNVKILLREIPKQDWGIRGGQAACDVELGYKTSLSAN